MMEETDMTATKAIADFAPANAQTLTTTTSAKRGQLAASFRETVPPRDPDPPSASARADLRSLPERDGRRVDGGSCSSAAPRASPAPVIVPNAAVDEVRRTHVLEQREGVMRRQENGAETQSR